MHSKDAASVLLIVLGRMAAGEANIKARTPDP